MDDRCPILGTVLVRRPEDYEEHRPKITEIFDLLDATPFLHKHTEETDSGDIMRKNLRHVAAFRHPGATRLPQTRS